MVDLPTWPRRSHVEGAGRAYVHWVVFGHFRPLHLDPASYRSRGAPIGVHQERVARDDDGFPRFVFVDTWAAIAEQDHPGLLDRVARAPQAVVLEGAIAHDRTLDYLRDLIGLVTCLLDGGGVGVCDVLALKWWTPEAFQHQLFTPRRPMPFQHVSILASPEPGGRIWLHTHGMRLFGRPDVSIRSVAPEEVEPLVEVINRFIAAFAEGMAIGEGEEVVVEMLKGAWVCHHRGTPDDPLFHNVYLEVSRQ